MMEKKVTTINIREDVLRRAKREIPNLSDFVEKCIINYLHIIDDDNDNVATMQEELNKIKEAQLKLHLLSAVEDNRLENQLFDNEKTNKTWSNLWRKARNGLQINNNELDNASSILNKNKTYLADMIETLNYSLPNHELSQCEDWKYAIQCYEQMQ